MTQVTDTDIREIKSAIDANTRAISDLREEIRVGFANVNTQITRLDGDIKELRSDVNTLDTKVNGRINALEAVMTGKFDKLDERTKVGFWGFILRGVVLALIIGVGGYLLPIVAEYVHKLPNL